MSCIDTCKKSDAVEGTSVHACCPLSICSLIVIIQTHSYLILFKSSITYISELVDFDILKKHFQAVAFSEMNSSTSSCLS